MQFSVEHTLDSELRRVGNDLIDRALRHLRRFGQPDRDVHESRKLMKKLRGLVRLTGKGTSADTRRAANRCWRDVARVLAPARESFVRMRTIETLRDRYGDLIEADAVTPVLLELDVAHQHLIAELAGSERLARAIDELASSREYLQRLALEPGRPASGIEGTYRASAKRLRTARVTEDEEDFHEWRKPVKYLWYQHIMIGDAWPEMLGAWTGELHRLSNLLGDEHDLADLEVALDSPTLVEAIRGKARRQIHKALLKERRALRRDAVRLGSLLHADRPRCFRARLQACLDITWGQATDGD